ncbi:P52 family lipoprotein [Borreliella burgdorferi]|uniref:P52 family lipoprotein n=1 Tax=Borreliella burgdorferi TaxID=139 RepID=UPI001E471298|nr:P52 family lipoprotein [Borreliella burgdorferi]MCD2320830.1 P52 family lipoprotein [Borreliella burgdorferi]
MEMFFYEKYMVENIYTYLELNAIEIITLKDIKKSLYEFYKLLSDMETDINPLSLLSPVKSHDILNEFLFSLGSKRAKELIKLFCEIKTNLGNNVFENEVFIFYLSISDINFFKLLYLSCSNNVDNLNINIVYDESILIYQKFYKIKKNLELITV